MADSPSGFRSWQDELDLNGEQEQQMLERAMEEARATRAQAQHKLSTGTDEARAAQLREAQGGGIATTTLSATGSYADYQRLKQQAQGQYQAALRGGGGVAGMVRRARAKAAGVNDAWTRQGDQLEARERQALDASTAGAAGANRLGAEQKARDDAKATADKARQQESDAARSGYLADLYQRWLHRDQAAPSDTQRGAQQLSQAIDEGWRLPERTAAQMGTNPDDRRGFGIEQDAWGTRPMSSGRPTTKKGTRY